MDKATALVMQGTANQPESKLTAAVRNQVGSECAYALSRPDRQGSKQALRKDETGLRFPCGHVAGSV